MKSLVLQALQEILKAPDPDAYLEAQNRALGALSGDYSDLLDIAKSHARPDTRSEALHLVMLFSEPDHQVVLDDARESDPERWVRDYAEGLLFQCRVAERAMNSGLMKGENLRTYLRSVRRQLAERRFAIRKRASAKAEVAAPNRRPARRRPIRKSRKGGGR